MRVAFTLTFPRNNTWNGKSNYDNKEWVLVRDVAPERAKEITQKGNYSYHWDDGWCANIECYPAKYVRKRNNGFCGYEWMIDSIIKKDVIECT